MKVPKTNRIAVYEYLFKEGVMIAMKGNHGNHPIVEAKNLHVISLMTSLKSRGFVRESFTWRHYYWFLTNEGIAFLRDFLHLPPEIVPVTLRRSFNTSVREPTKARIREFEEASGRSRSDGASGRSTNSDRDYRGTGAAFGGGADKKADVGTGANESFKFRGGFGRGKGGSGERSERFGLRDQREAPKDEGLKALEQKREAERQQYLENPVFDVQPSQPAFMDKFGDEEWD